MRHLQANSMNDKQTSYLIAAKNTDKGWVFFAGFYVINGVSSVLVKYNLWEARHIETEEEAEKIVQECSGNAAEGGGWKVWRVVMGGQVFTVKR